MGTDGYRRRYQISARRVNGPARPDYQFYGRRYGHPIRSGRKRLLAARLPNLRLPPADDTAAVAAMCDDLHHRFDEIWLEIGFGGGEHLLHQAASHPRTAIIGGEPFQNGVASVVVEIEEQSLDNIRLVDDDIRPWLPVLPQASIDRAFILFPDPWPKTRHHKRRIVSADNLNHLARLLRDGAELRIASDDMGYIRVVLDLALRHPAFEWTAHRPADWRQRPADALATRYEEKARRAGRDCVFLTFARRPRDQVGQQSP